MTTKIVTPKEFEIANQSFINSPLEKIPTPPEELLEIEKLLDLPVGTLPVGAFSVKCANPVCPSCNRVTTWKEVVVSALRVHSAAFLAKALTGEMGLIVRSEPPKNLFCSNCGEQLDGDKYCGGTYYCVRF
jgi:hypothetical protein